MGVFLRINTETEIKYFKIINRKYFNETMLLVFLSGAENELSSWFKIGQEFKRSVYETAKPFFSLFNIYTQLLLSGRLETYATPLAKQQSCAEELLKFLQILGEV